MEALGTYNGTLIECHVADDTLINATQMCAAAGKRWNDYWRTNESQEFVKELSLSTHIPVDRLIVSRPGRPSRGGGTWVHELIAMDLARWCDAQFAVWMAKMMVQLMKTGKVVLHQEHQEAQLSTSEVGELLHLMHKQNDKFDQLLEDNARTVRMNYDTLAELQRRTPEQLEQVVEKALVDKEGGLRQREIAAGYRVDVIIPDEWVIEVKHWKQWLGAIGQILSYIQFFDAEYEKRIHLFWKPYDSPPTDRKRAEIEKRCRRQGIHVTWHSWDDFDPPANRQQLLPLSY